MVSDFGDGLRVETVLLGQGFIGHIVEIRAALGTIDGVDYGNATDRRILYASGTQHGPVRIQPISDIDGFGYLLGGGMIP
jgi:NaMN:DMB phosphoribosyltransferase